MPRFAAIVATVLVAMFLPRAAMPAAASGPASSSRPAAASSATAPADAQVGIELSAGKADFQAAREIKLTLRIKNANAELKAGEGILELRAEEGQYELLRVTPAVKLVEGRAAAGDQVWELVVAGDAAVDVWARNATSSAMLPPIKGLPAGKYQVRWMSHWTPAKWKYQSKEIRIEIVEPKKASQPAAG